MIGQFDWANFLDRWRTEVRSSFTAKDQCQPADDSGSLHLPPATDDEIADAERRLKISLPPSYKTFLKVSNGWRKTSSTIDRLWGTDRIDWFRKRNKEWISAYTIGHHFGDSIEPVPDEIYYAYGPLASDFRHQHMKETLQISEIGDAAVYLLNPQVITQDGEWEAWFLANWLPGVRRFRSFGEMMQAAYAQFAATGWEPPPGLIGGIPDEYIGSPGNPRRRVKSRKRGKAGPSMEALHAALHDPAAARRLFPKAAELLPIELMSGLTPDGQTHRRVVMELVRLRDTAAIDPLLAMLAREEEPVIRQELIQALGVIPDPRAVAALTSLLNETDPTTRSMAQYQLSRFHPTR